MKVKSNKTRHSGALLLIGGILLGYLLWLSLRPVEIVAVHQNGSHSYVLVKNFPMFDNAKIAWWLENKAMLKAKYGIPKPESDGYFSVIFWLFGEGYKETDGYDRLCFDDMKTEKNCIEKNKVFTITNSKNMGMIVKISGDYYRLKENGKIVKVYYK